MTDLPEALAKHALPWPRRQRRRSLITSRRPALLIGAAAGVVAVGVAGFLAWRNRERIARAARPVIETARVRGQSLRDNARAKGRALIDNAKGVGQAIGERLDRVRRGASRETGAPKLT